MRYIKPNFEFEWEEAKRYPEFVKMGKNHWLKLDGEPKRFSSIQDVTGNVDLNFKDLDKDKKNRFYDAFDSGVIEMPIVVKFSDNDYDLVAGNTRLSGLILNKKDPYVWVIDLEKHKMKESENLKDGKSLASIGEKHNPYEEDDDKDDVFPTGSSDWRKGKKKSEVKEMGADCAGAFEAPFGGSGGVILKKDIHKLKSLPNAKAYNVNEQAEVEATEEEFTEATTASVSASGAYDTPFGGGGPKGRKNPLKIDGPDSIYKGRAVKDKHWPRFGGPGGVYVKVKEKCKKFPYCNQGDIHALEFIHEAIEETAKKHGVSYQEIEKIVLKEINKIFI